jgi:hypothetical protein
MINRSLNNLLGGLILLSIITLSACGGGGGGGSGSNDPPPTGTLDLTVVDGESTAGLSDARVIVIDGATGESIDVLTTDETGRVSKIYNTGALQLRVSKQNYAPSPPGIPRRPCRSSRTDHPHNGQPLCAPAAERGMISGDVTDSQAAAIAC